jgi:hypothetical protein
MPPHDYSLQAPPRLHLESLGARLSRLSLCERPFEAGLDLAQTHIVAIFDGLAP